MPNPESPDRSNPFGGQWWRPWAISALVWVGMAFVLASYRVAMPSERGPIDPFGRALLRELAFWASWAPLTPGLFWATEGLIRDPERRKRRIPILVLLGVVAVVSHTLLFAGGLRAFGVTRFTGGLFRAASQHLRGSWYWEVIVYAGIVSVAIASGYRRHLHLRERETADLRRQLVEAQLVTLRMQLQPHFLFNTLHAISVLVRRNPEEATAVIARLGDLLRATLQETQRQEVPLRKELEILRMYLDIEQTRFRDRLSIQLEIASDTLGCFVPSFLLQPLVENAIHHGIEARMGAGCIRISAHRQDGWLHLSVADDGEGLRADGDPVIRQGVGVANTRDRLAKLYGLRHDFSLQRSPEGGTVALIRIPSRVSDSTAEEPVAVTLG